MEMPERVKICSDNSLELYLDGSENAFKIKKSQYFKSDRGKLLLKHTTIMQLVDLLGIDVGPPVLLCTHSTLVYVISRTAKLGNRSCTEIGETNNFTLFDDIMKINPATTADNRAYDRAVLKLLRIYGEVYGASEINYKDEQNSSASSKKEPKKQNDSASNKGSDTATEQIPMETLKEKPEAENKLPFWWNETGVGVFKESDLDPETCIVTHGPCAGKNWTVKQLYDYQYKSCAYFAERKSLENADTNLQKQVYTCRRAIRKYGIKQ